MRKLFNDGWEFAKTLPDESAAPEDFTPVELPHDWLIYNTADLYESSYGHYRKKYDFGKVEGRCIRLYFEGVYMDSTVFLDGQKVMDWKYGYSSFEADLTPFLTDGEHLIEVLVRHVSPNSRWYSGAGIFRDVWFIDSEPAHFVTDGSYFHAESISPGDLSAWKCMIAAEVKNPKGYEVTAELRDGGKILYTSEMLSGDTFYESSTEGRVLCCSFGLEGIKRKQLWDIDNPHLMTLCLRMTEKESGRVVDSTEERVGLRQAVFDPDRGFFLNGRHRKINGVCLHHDLGALGSAFHISAAKRQLRSMQEMGANAVRTSHNMPAPGFMKLCDELGILVDSEAFDMWENPKTEYDYARFFREWMEKDVAGWIRRDRNHPSVIMWSVGNEITDTNEIPKGREIARALHRAVRKHDPLKNAPTTIGSNYMEGEGARGCAEEMDLAGYNYLERLYEVHHRAYPDWKIYGSETTSCPKSRGVYHFPLSTVSVTYVDGQCSSLGNSRNGADADTTEKVICMNRDIDCCAGMFIWTGSDYIGEPTPYSTKNSYYGNIDTAGLRKDSFYLYRAAWTKKPVLHLMPYWDYNPGQLIDVMVYTNLKTVELFINGLSCGIREPEEYTAVWKVPYEKGELLVRGFTDTGEEYTDIRRSFGDSARIVLKPDLRGLVPEGGSILAVKISVEDKKRYPVQNARDRIYVSVSGGKLLGFDNGDSTDTDSYKADNRRLFSGKAVVLVGADPSKDAGPVTVRAEGAGLIPAEITVDIGKKISRTHKGYYGKEAVIPGDMTEDIPVRKIELIRTSGSIITPDKPASVIKAVIFPKNATWKDIKWNVVTDGGITSPAASIEENDAGEAVLSIHGDGSFRVQCMAFNGNAEYPQVISELEYTARGFGRPVLDPRSFIPAGLYTDSEGEMNLVREGGVGITQKKRLAGFQSVDFGEEGAEAFTVRLINWFRNTPVPFSLWLGRPETDGARCLGHFEHQAEFTWQTYKENRFELPEKLYGMQDVYFLFDETDLRVDFGGFSFM